MATLAAAPSAFFLAKASFSAEASRPTLEIGIGVGDRDRLAVEVEAGEDRHRQRLVVLRHLAGRRSGRASASGYARRRCRCRAEPSTRLSRVVPQEACLTTSTSGMPCFSNRALFLGDDQRRGIGERDEAEDGLGGFRAGRLRKGAGGKGRLDRAEQSAVAAVVFRGCGGVRPCVEVLVIADSSADWPAPGDRNT